MQGKRAVERAEKRRLWQAHLDRLKDGEFTRVEYRRLHNLDANFNCGK
jgi:hypothetical protein